MPSSTSSGCRAASAECDKTPAQREIDACSRWLDGELAALAPKLIVCLGATAARSVLGPAARVGALRGRVTQRAGGAPVLVAVHRSYVLRLRGADRADLVRDLAEAARYLRGT